MSFSISVCLGRSVVRIHIACCWDVRHPRQKPSKEQFLCPCMSVSAFICRPLSLPRLALNKSLSFFAFVLFSMCLFRSVYLSVCVALPLSLSVSQSSCLSVSSSFRSPFLLSFTLSRFVKSSVSPLCLPISRVSFMVCLSIALTSFFHWYNF